MRRLALAFAAALFAVGGTSAGEMKLTGSDADASFLPLGLNKSVVIDLPEDISDVLVANPATVNVVVRSKRRVYVIGMAPGQSNVYFFDAKSRQIGALNISVLQGSPKPPSESNPDASPANVIAVYRGVEGADYSCTPKTCIGPQKPDDKPAPQVAININNN